MKIHNKEINKQFVLKLTSVMAAGACMLSLFTGCNQNTTESRASETEDSVVSETAVSIPELDKTKEYPQPKEQRTLCGTFLQYWYASGWSEGRWNLEMKNMVDNGMQYLIVPVAVTHNNNSSGDYICYYPTKIEGLPCSDQLEILFQTCEKYGIKVFIGTYADEKIGEHWERTHESTDDSFGIFIKKYVEMNNRIAKELYDLYAAKYPNSFYGWYFSDELYNIKQLCKGGGKTRDNLLDMLASCFNGILDYYTQISPGKPMLMSPYCNRTDTTAPEFKRMWIDLFAKIRFRQGDVFCPQDSIGGYPQDIKILAERTQAYREAADTVPGLRFWMNNENFSGDAHALLDRFVNQLTITSAYCEANVTFSWQHHYSPYHENVNTGYSDTYHDFLVNKKLETQPPTAPKVTCAKNEDGKYEIYFTGAKDNIGIAGFNIYRNKDTNLATSTRSSKTGISDHYIPDFPGKYYVEAFDFANNHSPKVEVDVPKE